MKRGFLMSKVLLIVNPSSGGEKAKSYEDLAREKLAECFDEVVVKHTEKGGDAAAFAKQAAEDHYDSVFVMGGDGTRLSSDFWFLSTWYGQ